MALAAADAGIAVGDVVLTVDGQPAPGAPVPFAAPGEEVTLETRDANDLQIHAGTTARDLEKLERTVAHPLTGPVYVKGAEPGDLLEIEYLDIRPERYAAAAA